MHSEPKSNGNYEVHSIECSFCPEFRKQISLHYHDSIENATKQAKKLYPNLSIIGCVFCK